MKKPKKPPRARTQSRAAARKHDKLAGDRERLARLERGGSAELPIEIEAASQLALRAESQPCLRCDGVLRYLEDRVLQLRGELRRAATMECKQCGARRELWFQIVTRLLN